MRKLPIAFLLFIAGCSTTRLTTDTKVPISSSASINLVDPHRLLPEMRLIQFLTLSHAEKQHSSQVILTNRNATLSVVALLPFGGEAFRVEYRDGAIHSSKLPYVRSDLDLKYALADIALALSDEKLLEAALSPSAVLDARPRKRVVLVEGKPVISIRYDSDDRFRSKIEYEHLERKYRILITPVSQEFYR